MHQHRRGYLQACLLLLLAERPDHGYELAARLAGFGLTGCDAAITYRALRGMERAGTVTSCWMPSPAGPARRIYRLTARGRAALADCGNQLRQDQARIARYLHRLAAVPDQPQRVPIYPANSPPAASTAAR